MSDPSLPGYAGTRGLNPWEADAALRAAAGPRLSAKGRERASAFGALVGGRLGELIEAAHKPEKLPRLLPKDVGGERVDAVEYCAEQVGARQMLARALYGREPLPLVERMTLAVLSNYDGEGGITCPLAMTEGLIALLERRGSDAQKTELLPRLRSDDAVWALTGGQFITERQGGSNVSANETVAEPRSDGAWSLTGEKWFCSNPGELWLTTAKVAGTNTIAMFVVRRRLPDGRLNGHRILRLKPIGGTRGKATVEVEYKGARAEMIGKPREGLAILSGEVLSVSRLHVAAAALGFGGRALLEAETFADWRVAYGRRIKDMPSVAARLTAMRSLHSGMLNAFYAGLDALRDDAPDAEAIVPILKVEVSRRATELIREAQLLIGGHGILDDFSPLNRLADDAIVNEIWEGTHPILAAHAAKMLRRPRTLDAFLARAKQTRGLERPSDFASTVEESRTWSLEEREMRDGEIAGAAYLLLAAVGR